MKFNFNQSTNIHIAIEVNEVLSQSKKKKSWIHLIENMLLVTFQIIF